MSQKKGYERFLKNANPKLEMTEEEYNAFRKDRKEFMNQVDQECKDNMTSLLKLTKSGQRVSFAFLSFLAAAFNLFLGLIKTDRVFAFAYLSLAAVFFLSGVITVSTIMRKSGSAPKDLDALLVRVHAYHNYHGRLIDRTSTYSEYCHRANMSNDSDFEDILQQSINEKGDVV